MRVAIIGAGMAGLTAAGLLKRAGVDVHLFDKGRGPGGRMSTRRSEVEGQTLRFDHGAQYISPETEAFAEDVSQWFDAGIVGLWEGRRVAINEAGDVTPIEVGPAYVGIPGMNEIIRYLASDHAVEWGRRVSTVERHKSWQLNFEDGSSVDGYDRVIIAVPAEQVSDIIATVAPHFANQAKAVISNPCWTVMAAFKDRVAVPWDAASFAKGPFAWVARNSSKPGRAGDETWVLQASAAWSRDHLEEDRDALAIELLRAFQQLSGAPEPIFTAAHLWRYSQVSAPAPQLHYLDAEEGLGVCGDWCSGPKVEDAWTSGRALAKAMLASL